MDLGRSFLKAFDVFLKFHLICNISFPDDLDDFYYFFMHILKIGGCNETNGRLVTELEKVILEEEEDMTGVAEEMETAREEEIEIDSEQSEEKQDKDKNECENEMKENEETEVVD